MRGGNLFVLKVETGEERQLTTAATETLTYGLAEFVAQEEMARMHGYWWSPDSQSIIYQETDTSEVETLYIADPAHPERPAQSWRYPRPGKNNARVQAGRRSPPAVADRRSGSTGIARRFPIWPPSRGTKGARR